MSKMSTAVKKSIHDLDYHALLAPYMLEDGTIDAMFEDGFGRLEDHGSLEEQKAWVATKEYCLKYLKRFFAEGEGAWDTLGDLSISLSMFYDGYMSATKREVAEYN